MENDDVNECSTHLYDTVPLIPPNNNTPTLEDSRITKFKHYNLPPEGSPAHNLLKQYRPKTSMGGNTIFSNMTTPYDISHRYSESRAKPSRIPQLQPTDDPTILNIHPPRGKFWVAQQRKEAQELKEQLSRMEREASENINPDDDDFKIQTQILERKLIAYERTMIDFTAKTEESAPERAQILQRITNYYRKLSDQIPNLKEEFEQRYRDTEKYVKEAEERKKKIKEQHGVANAAIDKLIRTIEALKSQINELRTRCRDAENQVRDAVNEKGGIARASQTNQNKLLDIGRQIIEKRAQLKKINELIETLTTDIKLRTDEMQKASIDLSDLEENVRELNNESQQIKNLAHERQQVCLKLRATPLRKTNHTGRCFVSIQVNRLPKPEVQKKPHISTVIKSEIDGQDQFAQIKSDMAKIQESIPFEGGKIKIESLADLDKIRTILLQNNNIFDYSVKSITKARGGKFYLENCSDDEARIFAQWMMRRILRSACNANSINSVEVQTDAVDQIIEDDTDDLAAATARQEQYRFAPKSLLNLIKQSRFISLLTSDYSFRKPKPFDWVIKTIRSIFDEKTVDDRTNERDGLSILALPEYILIWAFRQYGSDDLIQKGCWDLFISAHHHMQRYLEITLFVRFLDENWTTSQLSFFLKCRAWGLKRCVSVPIEHLDLDEYFTETYMTKIQVSVFFHEIFKTTEPELVEDLTIRGCSCTDPERGNEDESACIPLQRILELAVGEHIDSRIRRLRRMLAFFKPVPRMTLKRFSIFIRSMLINIDPNMINSLYRSSLVPNTIRSEMDQEEFVRYYNSLSPIVPHNYSSLNITCEDFAEYSAAYAMVLNRWKKFSPFLSKMLSILNQHGFEEFKIITNEIRHQTYQLLEAKVSYDGVLFYQNYHRVLQTIMRACLRLNIPDAFSFSKQIGDFEDLIFDKFENLCDHDFEAKEMAITARKEVENENSDVSNDSNDGESEEEPLNNESINGTRSLSQEQSDEVYEDATVAEEDQKEEGENKDEENKEEENEEEPMNRRSTFNDEDEEENAEEDLGEDEEEIETEEDYTRRPSTLENY